MNKYQEALDKLKNMGDKDLYNERHLEWVKTLQDLINQEGLARGQAIGILWMTLKNIEDMYYEMKARSDARKVKHLRDMILKHIEQLEKKVNNQ